MKTKVGLFLMAALLVGAGDAPTTPKELGKFAGTWTVQKMTYDGEDQSKLLFKLVFKGAEGVVEGEDSVKTEYARIKIKLDPAATPKIIDFTVSAGSQKGAVVEGIYEFKGDELRICAKVGGKDRPAAFASPDSSGIVLLILKREKP